MPRNLNEITKLCVHEFGFCTVEEKKWLQKEECKVDPNWKWHVLAKEGEIDKQKYEKCRGRDRDGYAQKKEKLAFKGGKK